MAFQSGSGHIWVLEYPGSGAFLHELDGDGLFLNEFDISASLLDGGGLAFDSRNGDLLVTSIGGGGNEIVRLDETDPGLVCVEKVGPIVP